MAMACGYRFRPTHEELIKYFLLKRASEKPLLYDDVVIDCDLCRKEPKQIFEENATDKFVYLFTTLKKKKKKTKKCVRFDRTVRVKDKNNSDNSIKVGTWKGKTRGKPGKPIRDLQGRVIGCIRNLVYESNLGQPESYKYVMKEYSLDGVTLRFAKVKDMVLCRIKRKVIKEKLEYNIIDGEVGAFENSGYNNVAIWEPTATVEDTFVNYTNQEEDDIVIQSDDHVSCGRQWIDLVTEELMNIQLDTPYLSDQSLLFYPQQL